MKGDEEVGPPGGPGGGVQDKLKVYHKSWKQIRTKQRGQDVTK